MGRLGSDSPDRLRRMAWATAATASSWPTTRRRSISSMRTSLATSPSSSRETGTPVHLDTTSAMSSSSTSSFSIFRMVGLQLVDNAPWWRRRCGAPLSGMRP